MRSQNPLPVQKIVIFLYDSSYTGVLSGYRRLRTGDMRIVYKVNETLIEVYILNIGPRRDDEIYDLALKRALGVSNK